MSKIKMVHARRVKALDSYRLEIIFDDDTVPLSFTGVTMIEGNTGTTNAAHARRCAVADSEVCAVAANFADTASVAESESKKQSADFYPIYIGDDKSDDDALAAVKDKGLSIIVSPTPRKMLKYRLSNPAAVQSFLELLLEIN